MKKVLLIATLALAVVAAGIVLAEDKPAPKEIVFEAKTGKVTFNHEKHVELAKNDCAVCHDKLFPKDKSALGYKEGMHKKAEEAKTSCAGCHHAGGAAFESKANCNKCHVKG